MGFDRGAAQIAAIFTGVLVGPFLFGAWWVFPSRPIAWITLLITPLVFGFAYLSSKDGGERHYDRLHAWYRTSKGRSSLQIVYLVLGVALGAYALLSQSWFAGAFAVASLASMYKPS